uniref:Uncharacterized protein n=1 Tax=Oryza barthii TaxID=65489 RepID=A0A0D3FT05_9ORYZ
MVNLEHHGPAPEATDDPSSHVSRHIYVGLSYDVTVVWEMQLESVEVVRGVVGDEQLNQLAVEFAIVDLNSWPSMTTHGMERHRSRHRRDSAHVCKACCAGRKDMIVWSRQSGSALRRSPSSSASGRLELIAADFDLASADFSIASTFTFLASQ